MKETVPIWRKRRAGIVCRCIIMIERNKWMKWWRVRIIKWWRRKGLNVFLFSRWAFDHSNNMWNIRIMCISDFLNTYHGSDRSHNFDGVGPCCIIQPCFIQHEHYGWEDGVRELRGEQGTGQGRWDGGERVAEGQKGEREEWKVSVFVIWTST